MKIRTFLQVYLTWVVFCAGSVSAHTQIFKSARVGSSAVLPCEWRNVSSPNPHVEWRTISETVFERSGEERYQGEGYEDRVDIPEDKLLKGNCSLVLRDVRPADAGVYESYLIEQIAKRRSKRILIQRVNLSIEAPTEAPETMLILRGTKVNCPSPWIIATSILFYLLLQRTLT